MEGLKDKYIMPDVVPLDSETEYFANFLCLDEAYSLHNHRLSSWKARDSEVD